MVKELRVLMVEDSEDDALLLLREIRKGGFDTKFERVDSPDAMREALERQVWEIIICDYVMPEFSGPAALKLMQEKGLDLPFIVVSGKVGEDAAVEMMKAGAHDYIIKGNLARLIPAVQRELREAQVRRERKEADEALRKAHGELEIRVKERTADLEKANGELQSEITERIRAEQDRERLLAELQQANGKLTVVSLERTRQAEEAERRAAELDATFMAIADGVVISDAESRVVRANPAAERMLGFAPEHYHLTLAERMALIGAETSDGKPFPLEEMPTSRALRYGESNYGVIIVLHSIRATKSISVSNSSSPIRSADGRIIGAVTVFSDITALHELQERREDLLRTVSHDLRNPLTTVMGQAQMLLRMLDKAGLTGAEHRSAEVIYTAAKRMNTMILDLVDSARIEAGELRLVKRPISLKPFVDELLDRNAGVIAISRIKVSIPADLPSVSADSDRLERILINLLTNALKYSTPETEVLVKAEKKDDEIELSVTDRGVGIAQEDMPHMFQRFYRAKGTVRAEGIGLGLYITRMLVEAHGGRIWVESQIGRGSTFHFLLPVAPLSEKRKSRLPRVQA